MKIILSFLGIAIFLCGCKSKEHAPLVSETAGRSIVRKNGMDYPYMQYLIVSIVPEHDKKMRAYGFFEISSPNYNSASMLVEFIYGARAEPESMEVSGYVISRPFGSPLQNFPKNSMESRYYNNPSGNAFGPLNRFSDQYIADFNNSPTMIDVFVITAVLSPPNVRIEFERQIGYNGENER